MKFYKENQINPAASCLPLVAQFPVFIALYFVLQGLLEDIRRPGDLSWLHARSRTSPSTCQRALVGLPAARRSTSASQLASTY